MLFAHDDPAGAVAPTAAGSLDPISLACAKNVPSGVGVTPIALLIWLLSMVMSVGDPAGAPAGVGKARHRYPR